MSDIKHIIFTGLFLLSMFACKIPKQQPHRYVDYQPYFDQTQKIFVKTPSSKNIKLDTLVQILSNLREEVYVYKYTISFDQEFEYSRGELIIDIDLINEKSPIFDTFLVVKDFLFKNEIVNSLFPIIPDSFKFALYNLTDTFPALMEGDSIDNDTLVLHDSISTPFFADTLPPPPKVEIIQKAYYTRNEILTDTTRDLMDADSILNNLLTEITWKKGDSIPYFKGYSNYQIDSILLLITEMVFVEIFDTSRNVKQYPIEKLSNEVYEKSIVSDRFINNDKVVFNIFHKDEEDVFVDMVKVQGGSFKIGCNEFDDDERPQYGLKVSGFLLGKYEITNRIFCAFMNLIHCDSLGKFNRLKIIDLNPYYTKILRNATTGRFYVLKGFKDYPVVNVSWAGANLFCKTVGGRLPSETEWEYAAKGGKYAVRYYTNINKSDYDYEYRFAGGNTLGEVGWFVDNSGGYCHSIGGLKPNQLGLYDMCGNVWEWCYDNYNKDFYKRNGDSTDPMCLTGSGIRVNRGGSWSSDAQYCRITNRNYLEEFNFNPYLGFRYMREWRK